MYFYLIGIDYKRAGLEIREPVYRNRAEIAAFWTGHGAREAAILATCNRFEIYGIAESEGEARKIAGIFRARFRAFYEYGYAAYGERDVFRHLLRLASGLESQIKGELQISNQLGAWPDRAGSNKPFADMVSDALSGAHEIRARSGLDGAENNIAALLFNGLLADMNKNFPLEVVIAGTGKIAELFAAHKPQGVRIYFAANKNILKARMLANLSGGRAVLLKELPELLVKADVLISATASPHYIFNKNYFSKIAPARESGLYVYDLAVPRDIDPAASEVDGIILKNIDDLTAIFERHNALLSERIKIASYLAEEAAKFYEVTSDDPSIESRHKAEPVSR